MRIKYCSRKELSYAYWLSSPAIPLFENPSTERFCSREEGETMLGAHYLKCLWAKHEGGQAVSILYGYMGS